MLAILDTWNRSAPTVLLIMFLVLITLAGLVVVIAIQHWKLKNRLKVLLSSSSGKDLEDLLNDILGERPRTVQRLDDLGKRIDSLERRMTSCQRFVGMVRYDAFGDVGGQQSFALAIYDERGDGVVVSSLVGRADCRVYCKVLAGGKSDRDLGKEEVEAIELAAHKRSKAAVLG